MTQSHLAAAPQLQWNRWRAALGGFACLCTLVACDDGASTAPAQPPIAGLLVPQVARVGQPVVLDASATAVAGTPLDRFVWTVADGSAAIETAAAQHSHTFAATGSYAVRVQVVDRAGRSTTATGRVEVVSDFAPSCAPGDTAGCAVGACVDGSCADLACAATPACAEALVGAAAQCVAGACVATAQ